MVMVSISETYDLHTVVNKMTLIGIHTPTRELIMKMYPGLCMNFKKFRIHSVDCVLATAQQMPLGVDEIGLDANQIHPQDVMNPILYKAVSNDSWSTLEARLMGLMSQVEDPNASYKSPAFHGDMAYVENDSVTGLADEHNVYYSLLANRDGFRTRSLQQGVEMRGLVPLVFDKWYTHAENQVDGFGAANQDNANGLVQLPADHATNPNGIVAMSVRAGSMRGKAHPMPAINTTYLTYPGTVGTEGAATLNGMDDGRPANCQVEMPRLAPVMLGAIVLPPMTTTTGLFYYRMVCRSHIEFFDPRPIQEITDFGGLDSMASLVYHTDYDEQSKWMDATSNMVDVKNGSIDKIMEGR